MTYAKETTVPWKKSKQEIEDLIEKRGGLTSGTVTTPELVVIAFEMCDRRIRFNLPLPKMEDFALNDSGRRRPASQVKPAYEKELRRRWRSLLLTIKSKFVSVEDGIEVFESAFMAQIVMPNNQTIEEWATPQIQQMYLSGKMPPLLPPSAID